VRAGWGRELLAWAALLAVLVLVAAAIAAVLADRQEIRWFHLVALTLVGACYAACFTLVKKVLVARLEPRATAGWQILLVRLAGVVAAAVAGTEMAAWGTTLLGGNLEESRANYFPVGLALTAVAALVDHGYEQLKRRARESELREERLAREALHAQLRALQARTDPHFLFNSLNTLAGLIEENPTLAGHMLEKLSGLFRHALEGSRSQRVRLADEVRVAEGYLEIEALRFGERLRWRVERSPGLEDLEVPPLCLQPLIENAVIHGIAPRRGPGRVEVRLTRREGWLRIEVEDDGPGPGASAASGSGAALETLRDQIELFTGGRGSLTTGRGPLGGFRAILEVPVEESGAA
jgi:two-component system sensor histidine kinase AlgZ